jgi:hypothetical protein
MKPFKELKGRRILVEVPELKKSALQLTEKDEEAMLKDAMKLWSKLTLYAVGDKVEGLSEGDLVYITTEALQRAEKVEIEGSIKLMLSEGDVALIW